MGVVDERCRTLQLRLRSSKEYQSHRMVELIDVKNEYDSSGKGNFISG